MKRYFILIMMLSLALAVSSSCLAVGTMGNQQQLSGRIGEGVRIVEVKASRYKFEPDPIVVKLGEKIRLVVTSTDVSHGLAVTEFKVNLAVPADETKSVEFVADKKGIFHVHCSVYCGPGHAHMHASFIVQ